MHARPALGRALVAGGFGQVVGEVGRGALLDASGIVEQVEVGGAEIAGSRGSAEGALGWADGAHPLLRVVLGRAAEHARPRLGEQEGGGGAGEAGGSGSGAG